jgi:hypothetical protein
MIITNIDPFQPSFNLYPVNDNTTGYKPVSLPMILVVPKRLDTTGYPVANSEVFLTKTDLITNTTYTVEGFKLLIENVPSQALIVGHQNRDKNGKQLRYPDKELYSREILNQEFFDTKIDLTSARITYFTMAPDGTKTPISQSDARSGSYFTYRTSSGIIADVTYYQGALYYDLSMIVLNDIILLEDGYYNLVYQTEYYYRNIINQGSLTEYVCIDILTKDLAFSTFKLNHPGEILSEFRRLTPRPYLNEKPADEDETIAFYRPFTTALQDIHDEQNFLEIINWLYETPAELMPYLSYQLGWDLPFFPKSLDKQRRAVLRKITSLQQSKGSRRSVVSIFNLFGFDVLLANLWWSTDGKHLIRPNEKPKVGYEDEADYDDLLIQFETVVAAKNQETPVPGQVIYYRYDSATSENFLAYDSYPLFRPQKQVSTEDADLLSDGGNLNLFAFKVSKNSISDSLLQSICAEIYQDPEGFAQNKSREELYHFEDTIVPKFIFNALYGQQVLGYSTVLISGEVDIRVRITSRGYNAPFKDTYVNGFNDFLPDTYTSIQYERKSNKLFFSFDNAIQNDEVVYVFAAYDKAVLRVPTSLLDRRSNYFDLELFLSGTLEQINPITLNYAIDFLNKVKAIHSLLRSIKQRLNLYEDYEVTDLGIGGDVTQRYDTDIGMLQVPPAIIPNIPTSTDVCFDYSPTKLGYKQADLDLRNTKIGRLEAEFLASERLDRIPFSATVERIMPFRPKHLDRDFYTTYNQDRVISGTRLVTDAIDRIPYPNSGQLSGKSADRHNPNPGIDIVLGDLKKFNQLSTNSDSSMVMKMMRQSTSAGDTLKKLDYITDYAYKGRVEDSLLYAQDITIPEEYRSMMGGLRLGSGSYYSYPYIATTANFGTRNPAQHSRSNYLVFSGKSPVEGIRYFGGRLDKTYLSQDKNDVQNIEFRDLLGKLYRSYPNEKNEDSIHYFDNKYNFDFDQKANLALSRGRINIDKPILHLPGCRFPTLNRLKNNYENTNFNARPWDDSYSTYCGPKGSCGKNDPTLLGIKQVSDGDNGNTTLIYDVAPYIIRGNNILPDISSLAAYVGNQDNNIVHKVFMKGSFDNPAITFEQVCDYDTSVSPDGEIVVNVPLFPYVYDGTDYADGYPCLSGIQNLDATVEYEYAEALEALGLPTESAGYIDVLYLLGSGIRCELGYRLSSPVLNDKYNNDFSLYINQDGKLQTDSDFIIVNNYMSLDERLSIEDQLLDGSIPSLLETLI